MSTIPVVLVHGFMASPLLLRPMKRQLERQGFVVYLVQLSPLSIQDIRQLADRLGENIERVCWVEDVDEIDLVGVSLGGLTALYYQHFVAKQRRIRRFIALGSPFHGTGAARTWLPVMGKVSEGIWQVLQKIVPAKYVCLSIHEPSTYYPRTIHVLLQDQESDE